MEEDRLKDVADFKVAEAVQEGKSIDDANHNVFLRRVHLHGHLELHRCKGEDKEETDGHLLGEELVLLDEHEGQHNEHRVGAGLLECRHVALAFGWDLLRRLWSNENLLLVVELSQIWALENVEDVRDNLGVILVDDTLFGYVFAFCFKVYAQIVLLICLVDFREVRGAVQTNKAVDVGAALVDKLLEVFADEVKGHQESDDGLALHIQPGELVDSLHD